MWSRLRHIPPIEARAATLSVSIGIVLLVIKFIAYFLTGSAAIFSDAMESIVNVLASGFALFALSVAHSPADAEHPYGHGKIEFLSAALEGGMILLAALVIAAKTINAMILGEIKLEKMGLGLELMAAAMLINGGLGLYLIRTGRKQNSLTLEADGKHLLSDAITSIGVLIALGIVALSAWLFEKPWIYADPIAALVLAAYLGYMSYVLLRSAVGGLMDKQDMEHERLLSAILDSHRGPAGKSPHICSYHKLRHRHSGRYHWVDFHIFVPAHLSIEQGHAIATAIETEIEQSLGEGNATAHVEPCAGEACTDCPDGHVTETAAPA